MKLEDLGPAERFTAGAIGPPGHRHFYFQITAGGREHWLGAEKEQVRTLAVEGSRILAANRISIDTDAVANLIAGGLELHDPGSDGERFQVGDVTLAMGINELLTCTIAAVDGDQAVSFIIAPEQFQAMAAVALEVVAAGRPICRWCQLPMSPDDHQCPGRN